MRRLTYSFTADDGAQSIAGLGSFDGWDQTIPGLETVEIDCAGSRVEAPVISPESGTRVPIEMTITSGTEGAAIYFTLDGSEPTENATRYESPIQIDSPTGVKARAYKNGLYRSQEARAKFRAQYAQKALFVVGGPIGNGNNLWPSTLRAAEHGYRALLYQGFEKDEIQLLAPSLELDFDGNDDFDDVDGIASSTEIEQSLLAGRKMHLSWSSMLLVTGAKISFRSTGRRIARGFEPCCMAGSVPTRNRSACHLNLRCLSVRQLPSHRSRDCGLR